METFTQFYSRITSEARKMQEEGRSIEEIGQFFEEKLKENWKLINDTPAVEKVIAIINSVGDSPMSRFICQMLIGDAGFKAQSP